MNDKSKNNDLLGISLIIDENNVTHIDIDSKKVDNLNSLVGKVCKKYNLDNKTKEKLGKEINKRIDDLIKNKKYEINKKNENTINRLYYESIEKIKEKNAFLEAVRKEKEEEVLNTYPFSPIINKNSNLLYEKTYLRIEDKLYYEFKILKEKQNFTRLITEISSRSKSRNKNNLKNLEQKNKSMSGLKRINITKNSNFMNNKENISERNFLILNKLSTHSKEKAFIKNNSKEKLNKNLNKINTENYLNIDEVSYINKNKTFNTDNSLEDSYLNLKVLPNKLEEKSNILERIDDKREYEIKNTIINIENKKTSTNNIIEINKKSPKKRISKAIGENTNLKILNNEFLAKTPAFFKNFDIVLESTSRIMKKRNTLASNNPDVFLAELSKRFSFNNNNTNFEKNSYTKRYRTLTNKSNLNVNPTSTTNTNYLKSKTRFSLNQNQITNNLNNFNINNPSNNENNSSVNQFHLNLNDSAIPTIESNPNESQVNQYLNTMPNAVSKNLNQERNENFSPNEFDYKEKNKISKNSNKRNNFQNNIFNINLNNNGLKEKENLNNYNFSENCQFISDDNKKLYSKINNSKNLLNLAQITSYQNTCGSIGGSKNYNNFSNLKESGKEGEMFLQNNLNKINEFENKNNYNSPQKNSLGKKNSSIFTTTIFKKDSSKNNLQTLSMNNNILNLKGNSKKESKLPKSFLTTKEVPQININNYIDKSRFSNEIQDQLNLNINNPPENLAKSIVSNFMSFGEGNNNKVNENIKKINNTDKNLYHIRIEQNHFLKDSYENNLKIIDNDQELKNFNSESFKNDTHITNTNNNNISYINTTSLNNNLNIPSKFLTNENEKINKEIIDTKQDSVDNKIKNSCSHMKNLKKKKIINKKSDFPLSKSLETKRVKHKYLIKTERGNKDIFNYLYDTRNDTKNFRKNFSKEIFSQIHTFKPEIFANSVSNGKLKKSNKKEIQDNLFKRLAESKLLKNILYIKDLKYFSTISSLEKENKLISKHKIQDNFNKISNSDGIMEIKKSFENINLQDENDIKYKITQKNENEENNNPSDHFIHNKKKYQTIDTYTNISLRNDVNKNLNKKTNYLKNNNDILRKNKLNNQQLISIMKSMNNWNNKFPDKDFNMYPKNNIINKSIKTQQEGQIIEMTENIYKNINYLSQSIQSSNFNRLKLDPNSSCTNSKMNIISSKRNDTQNTNDDLLNSNDFKISNSNMFLQQSKNNLKNEDNKNFEVKSIFKLDNNNDYPQSNLLSISSNEIGKNFFDKLIDVENNSNSNLDDYIEAAKDYLLTDNCNYKCNLPFKNPNITDRKSINNILENNMNTDFNKKDHLHKEIVDINSNSNYNYEKACKNNIFEEDKVILNNEKQLKFYPINSNCIYKKNNLEHKILDSEINSEATFIVHKTESVQDDKLINENFEKNKFSTEIKDISNSSYNFKKNKKPRIRETKHLRELREEEKLYVQLDEIKKERMKHENLIKKRYAQNIDKVKINNLKEIFELVIKNNKDIEKLKESGVSCFLIEQLILPVIKILQKRNLEFNFNNFYSLAKEFLNRLF